MAVVFISNPTAPALALPAAAAFNGSEIFALDQTNGGVLSTRGGSITQLATFLGSSGGFISAVQGTANEITATTVSGTTTLSFPSTVIFTGASGSAPVIIDSANGPSVASGDLLVNRAGSTANSIGQGPNIQLQDTTNN